MKHYFMVSFHVFVLLVFCLFFGFSHNRKFLGNLFLLVKKKNEQNQTLRGYIAVLLALLGSTKNKVLKLYLVGSKRFFCPKKAEESL